MTRAAIYARVSSQAQRERHTVASQLRALPDFVAARGWELIETYVDDGMSAAAGKLERRDAFTRLLADAAAHRFDVVVVIDLDRLTRSEDLTERGQVLGAFQRAGVQLAIASSGQVLDLNSGMGDLLSLIQAWTAAEENRKRRERTVRGKIEAARSGRKPAGPTPFGYEYSREGGWSVDATEAELVREVYQRILAGDPCQRIADDWTTRGLRGPRGGRWSLEAVWRLATQRTYLGAWLADKRRGLSVPVPAITSEEEWRAVQEQLGRHRRRGLRRTRHVYLVEGIGRCGLCGADILIHSARPDGHGGCWIPAYYTCRARRRRNSAGLEPCRLPFRRVSEVDDRLWAALQSLLARRDLLEAAMASRIAQARADEHDWGGDLKRWQRALKRNGDVEAAILARFRLGAISEAAMDAALEETTRERRLLGRQVETAKRAAAGATRVRLDAAAVAERIEKLRARVATLGPEERRDFVRAVIPGEGRHVVTLGRQSIEAEILLAAEPQIGLVSRAGWYTLDVADLSFRLVA